MHLLNSKKKWSAANKPNQNKIKGASAPFFIGCYLKFIVNFRA
jgi:hypothetical protein